MDHVLQAVIDFDLKCRDAAVYLAIQRVDSGIKRLNAVIDFDIKCRDAAVYLAIERRDAAIYLAIERRKTIIDFDIKRVDSDIKRINAGLQVAHIRLDAGFQVAHIFFGGQALAQCVGDHTHHGLRLAGLKASVLQGFRRFERIEVDRVHALIP